MEADRLCLHAANCTSEAQVADLVVNKPLKDFLRQMLMGWQAEQKAEQVRGGKAAADCKFETGLKALKGLSLQWIYDAWMHLSQMTESIKAGYKKAGTDQVRKYRAW